MDMAWPTDITRRTDILRLMDKARLMDIASLPDMVCLTDLGCPMGKTCRAISVASRAAQATAVAEVGAASLLPSHCRSKRCSVQRSFKAQILAPKSQLPCNTGGALRVTDCKLACRRRQSLKKSRWQRDGTRTAWKRHSSIDQRGEARTYRRSRTHPEQRVRSSDARTLLSPLSGAHCEPAQ